MRLIDADALLESVKDYPFVQHALQAQTGKMPTVDAIPVEWIEQYGKANWYDFGTQYNAITEMLEEWERKEK